MNYVRRRDSKICIGCGGKVYESRLRVPFNLWAKGTPGHSGYCARCRGVSVPPIPLYELTGNR